MTRDVCTHVVSALSSRTRVRQVGLMFGPGGYKQFPLAPSAQWDVAGTRAEVIAIERAVGYLLRQNEVIASSEIAGSTEPDHSALREKLARGSIEPPDASLPALDIVETGGANLHEAARLQKLWTRLGELCPALYQGFLPFRRGRLFGIRIINTGQPWRMTDYADFANAVESAGREFELNLKADPRRVLFDSEENRWADHPSGELYLTGLRRSGQTALVRTLQYDLRPRVDAWVLRAFRACSQRHGGLINRIAKPTHLPR